MVCGENLLVLLDCLQLFRNTAHTVTPYAAIEYAHLFSHSTTEVLTVLPERTFWEKVTILHREANRPKDREFPTRYSRH